MLRPCHFRAILKNNLDYNRLVERYRSLSEKHQRFSFELFSDTWRHFKESGQSYISSRTRRTQRTVHTAQTVLVLNCDTPKLTRYKVLSNSERSKSIARANEISV